MSFSLACVPDTVAAAKVYDKYGGSIFIFFSLFCGRLRSTLRLRQIQQVRYCSAGWRALALGSVRFPLRWGRRSCFGGQRTWFQSGFHPVNVLGNSTTVAFALAAIAILINRKARLAMRLMTLMLLLFGVLIWIPHVAAHPQAHFNWSELCLTFLVTGAAWTVSELKSF